MKKILFLLLNLSIAFAQYDYELLYFSSARLRSVDEIFHETKLSIEQLANFTCQNENRFNLFFDTHETNTDGESLKIISRNDPSQIFIFKNNQLYNSQDKLVNSTSDEFVNAAFKALKYLSKFEIVNQLISRLQNAKNDFIIQFGRNQYNPSNLGDRTGLNMNDALMIMSFDELKPMVDGLPFSQIGFAGRINWNHKSEPELMESDYVLRSAPAALSLAHEMMHAYDGLRGLLDRKMVNSQILEFSELSEFRAVYFENLTRQQMGLKYRRFYSAPSKKGEILKDQKDMLDEHDLPILLPTPCISWL